MDAQTTRFVSFALMGVGAVVIVLGFVNPFSGDGDTGEAQPTTVPAAATTTTEAEVTTVTTASPDTTAATTTTLSPATTSVPASTTTSTSTSTSTTTTTSSTTTTTIPVETPEQFLALFVEALRGDAEFLVARLNQATIDIYGLEQCQQALPQVLDAEASLEIREVGSPGPWDYAIDGIVTPITDALPVEVQRIAGGQTLIQELHWKLVGAQWTWFGDCGTPLS